MPPLVRQAYEHAAVAGYARSCSVETGRLLKTLAGAIESGTVAEFGTGYGAGSAWILSALRPEVSFVSVDASESAVESVRARFRDCANAEFLFGDWSLAERRARRFGSSSWTQARRNTQIKSGSSA